MQLAYIPKLIAWLHSQPLTWYPVHAYDDMMDMITVHEPYTAVAHDHFQSHVIPFHL